GPARAAGRAATARWTRRATPRRRAPPPCSEVARSRGCLSLGVSRQRPVYTIRERERTGEDTVLPGPRRERGPYAGQLLDPDRRRPPRVRPGTSSGRALRRRRALAGGPRGGGRGARAPAGPRAGPRRRGAATALRDRGPTRPPFRSDFP